MAFHFSKAFKVFVETSSFVFARIIANAYFVMFSAVIAVFFLFGPYFFVLSAPLPDIFLAAGIFVFLFYWSFFRKRILYVLKSSAIVVVSEFLSGRNIPVSMQASFGFNLIKKKFHSLKNFRKFEQFPRKVMRKIYGVLGFVSFIPNVNSAVLSSVISYVFADNSVDYYTSLRDSLVLFYQRKNFILFQIFAMQIFSYIIFFLSYLVFFYLFNPFIVVFSYPFDLFAYFLVFLLLLLIYSSFISHFLICWQIVFFIETIKIDDPKKSKRDVLENLSPEFNQISAKAKVFVPLKSLASRHLLASLEKTSSKKKKFLSSLDGIIKDKDALEEHIKGEDALSELVSEVSNIDKVTKKKRVKIRLEEEKQKSFEKYEKEREYTTVFNLLLEFLGNELGKRDKFEISSLQRQGENWSAVVLINKEKFAFLLDSKGKVIEFEEKQ